MKVSDSVCEQSVCQGRGVSHEGLQDRVVGKNVCSCVCVCACVCTIYCGCMLRFRTVWESGADM